MELTDSKGRARWIFALCFDSLPQARSFVVHSLIPLMIVSENSRFLVCSPDDAAWAVHCGCRTVPSD